MWEVPPAELRLAARHHQVDTTLQQIFCIDLGTQSASSASKSLCFIDIAIFVSSIWQYSQSRSSCCSKEDRRGGSLAPDVAATTAEQNSQVHVRCEPHNIACVLQHTGAGQVVLCPAEAPHKTKYRSTSGLVTCGQRMVGKCLCLDPDQPQVIGCHGVM